MMNPITFSTLACPHWQIAAIIANATEYGYTGIEWRGGPQGHVQPDMSAAAKASLRQKCSDAGIMSLAVTAYTSFVSDSAEDRNANVDELRRYADLGAELGAPYVRAFLGELPDGTNLDSSIYERMSECLNIASAHAASVGVKIAIEPHDDFVHSSTIVPILSRVQDVPLCVIWDIANAFSVGELPTEGFDLLKEQIAYVQVKDGKGLAPNWQLCNLGEGDVPLSQAFDLLLANSYQGAFSVEWEYAWHPELEPPEVALPAALQVVRNTLAEIRSRPTTNRSAISNA